MALSKRQKTQAPAPTLSLSLQAQVAAPVASVAGRGRVPHSLVKSCWMRGKRLPGPPRRMLSAIQVTPTVTTRATIRRGPGGRTDQARSPQMPVSSQMTLGPLTARSPHPLGEK